MAFKIRTKLIIAFFSIIFLFTVIGGILVLYSANAVHNSVHKIKSIAEERAVIANLIFDMEKALMPGNDYIITGEKKYIGEFLNISDDVEKIIKEAERIVSNEETKRVVGNVRIAFQNIKEVTQKIFEIPNPVGNKEAARLMNEMDYKWAYPSIEKLKDRWNIYMDEYRKAANTADSVKVHSWIIMIAGAFLLTAVGSFFALFYSRIFVLPIKQVHNGADAIAKGDFKVRLDIKTGDEIEQLSKAMNEMAKQLDTLYLNMGAKIEEGIKKFAAITESANDAIIVLSSPDVIRFWNKKAEEIFGYKINEVVGKSVHDLVVPQKFREKAKEGLNNFFKTGQGPVVGKVVEVFGIHKDGTEFPIELSVSAVRIGGEWQAIGIIRNVTERKRAEEELNREKEKAEEYLDISDVIIIAIDSNGKVTLINKKGCEVLGYQTGDVIGKDWFNNFIPQKEKNIVRNVFNQVMAGNLERGRYFENIVVSKSGEERLISWHNTVLTDDRGRITGTLSSGEDITDKKRAEEAIKESEERFRRLVEYSPHGIAVHSEGKLLYINPIGASLLGASDAKELIGRSVMDFCHPDYKERATERIRKILEEGKEATSSEEKFIRLDGSILDAEVSAVSVIYSGKQAVLVHFSDITERKEAEKTLNQRFDELEQFRKITINRELRMEELKRKNKELEEELKILRGMR